MLKFISFGSGSSGNSYLLMSDNTILMLDSGVGIRSMKRYFQEYGLSFTKVNAILVTHDHADHVKSVGAISNDFKIPVYATEAVHKGIQKNYCVRKKIDAVNKRVFLPGDDVIEIGDFKITPFDVPHDSCGNVGYTIEYHGVVFGLMTDIGHITDTIRDNIKKCNYLVIEANHDESMLQNGPYPQYLKDRITGGNGHLSNVKCAQTICECYTNGLKHVWLCHLSEENNHPELLRKTIEKELQENGLRMGGDIEVDILRRRQPTGFFSLS